MVDWDRIRELREEIGDEDHAEVMELFLTEVETALARLRLPGSAAEREADMHFLKGSAVNLGFTTFGNLCARGEVRAVEGTLEDSDILAVIDCFGESREVFAAGYARAA